MMEKNNNTSTTLANNNYYYNSDIDSKINNNDEHIVNKCSLTFILIQCIYQVKMKTHQTMRKIFWIFPLIVTILIPYICVTRYCVEFYC